MRRVFLSRLLTALTCLIVVLISTPEHDQGSEAADGLTAEEKESIQKAKDPEEQLKRFLDIANERLKIVLSASSKNDHENAEKAVGGYRTAVSGAEDTVATLQGSGKDTRKAMAALFKAVKRYNLVLLQALEKAPEDSRRHIQAAYEVSSRVQDGLSIQMEKMEKKQK
jgi:hypothetical protein